LEGIHAVYSGAGNMGIVPLMFPYPVVLMKKMPPSDSKVKNIVIMVWLRLMQSLTKCRGIRTTGQLNKGGT
jgi:hypothetical protein